MRCVAFSFSTDRILSLQESGFLEDLAKSFFDGTQDNCGSSVRSKLMSIISGFLF